MSAESFKYGSYVIPVSHQLVADWSPAVPNIMQEVNDLLANAMLQQVLDAQFGPRFGPSRRIHDNRMRAIRKRRELVQTAVALAGYRKPQRFIPVSGRARRHHK